MKYSLRPNPPEADDINVLIQRCVESGIYQFYKRFESFLAQLRKPLAEEQPDDMGIITMDNIWIYVYVYFVVNTFCGLVFIGELLYFQKKAIWKFIVRQSQKMKPKIAAAYRWLRDWASVFWQKIKNGIVKMNPRRVPAVRRFTQRIMRNRGNHSITSISPAV